MSGGAAAPRERVLAFGPGARLVGLLTLPERPVAGAPAVLLVNSGVLHRVGPNRLHVDAARAFAASGFAVLRFDLSGLGDSAPHAGAETLEDSIMADIRAGVDELAARTGAARVVCMGICLGADTSFRFAWEEPRVAGLVLLDPYTFRTWGFHVRKLVARLRERRGLSRSLARRLAAGRPADGDPASLPEHYRFQRPGREEMTRRLQEVAARGTRLLTIFSGGTRSWYNYRDQFRDAFPSVDFGDTLSLHHWPDVDHTFSTRASRARLVATATAWLHDLAAARHEPGRGTGNERADDGHEVARVG